jgi:hypothetical protein
MGPQSADKEAVEDTLQESELESARMENIIQSKMTEQLDYCSCHLGY